MRKKYFADSDPVTSPGVFCKRLNGSPGLRRLELIRYSCREINHGRVNRAAL